MQQTDPCKYSDSAWMEAAPSHPSLPLPSKKISQKQTHRIRIILHSFPCFLFFSQEPAGQTFYGYFRVCFIKPKSYITFTFVKVVFI